MPLSGCACWRHFCIAWSQRLLKSSARARYVAAFGWSICVSRSVTTSATLAMLRGSRWMCGLPDGWISPIARSITFGISSLTTYCEASMNPGEPGWMRSLPACVKSNGSQPISSSDPEQITRSALRMRETSVGRAWMRCGSCIGVTAENTDSLSPASSWESAAHSGSQANTFSAALAGAAIAANAAAAMMLYRVFMSIALEPVRAVRAQAHDVLEEHLRVGLAHARVVARKLQANAAELARIPVDHHAVLLRLVAGEDREIRRRQDGPRGIEIDRSRAQLVIAIAGAPLRQKLVDRLRVPTRLLRRESIGQRAAEGVERERPVFLAMEILALQLEVVVGRIAVWRPLQDAVDHPQPARAAEAVGHRVAERIHIVVAPVARISAQMRQAGLPGDALADVAAKMREEIERTGAVLPAAAETRRKCAAATELGAEIPVKLGRRDPAKLNAVFIQLSTEERFHRERRIGEVPGMCVNLVLIAQRREKAPGLDGETVREPDRLDVAFLDADAVVVRRDRPNQGAAEVVVDIRRERQFGFAETEAARRWSDIGHRRYQTVNAVGGRVAPEVGVDAVENHRDGGIQRALRLRTARGLGCGLCRGAFRLLDAAFQLVDALLQFLQLVAHLGQRFLRLRDGRCHGACHGAQQNAMHMNLPRMEQHCALWRVTLGARQ